jgi:hypothetical protein
MRAALKPGGFTGRMDEEWQWICRKLLGRTTAKHTFWNTGDRPARILEIISPAGFEKFFQELIDLGGVAKAPLQALTRLCSRYELDIDFDSIPGLVERFGVRFPADEPV